MCSRGCKYSFRHSRAILISARTRGLLHDEWTIYFLNNIPQSWELWLTGDRRYVCQSTETRKLYLSEIWISKRTDIIIPGVCSENIFRNTSYIMIIILLLFVSEINKEWTFPPRFHYFHPRPYTPLQTRIEQAEGEPASLRSSHPKNSTSWQLRGLEHNKLPSRGWNFQHSLV